MRSDKPKITGRKRYRILTRLFRNPVLVLQLEVIGIHTFCIAGMIESENIKWWVDANPEQLLEEPK